jgi:hypothetical protein
MKVQCVIPDLQRIEPHIESIIDGRRIYPCRDVSETSASARCIEHVFFGQCHLKDLRLDASQVFDRFAIDFN